MTRRLLPLLIQLVICIQAGFVAAIIPAAPIVPAVAAFSGACTVASGDAGGTVSACSDADTYAELVADLSATFEDLRGESATQPLSVTSTPVGASVEISGLSAGLTPLNTSVQAGSYVIRVSKSGFESYNTSVAVGDGGASLNATLNPVDDTPTAVSESIHPATLIALAGAPADCDFEIGNFVKDKVGDYYVSFSCFVQGSIPVDAPEEAPGFVQYTGTFHPQLRTSGVARTTDMGRSWTLIDSWTDTFTVRAWTSPRFADGAPGTPATDGTTLASGFDHWVRAYYLEKTSELWSIWGMVPRDTGGVSILLAHNQSHSAQELAALYDNAGPSNNPLQFLPANITQAQASGPWLRLAHPDMQARFGVSAEDLGTSRADVTDESQRVGSAGDESPISITGPKLSLARPSYQGSYQATDYFLGIGSQSSVPPDYNGHIFRSTDGGLTISLYKSYDIGLRGPEFTRSEELRIGPDGSLYVVDHAKGGVWAIEDAGPRLLGRAPESLNFGVSGGNNSPYLSVDFDSSGNLQGAFRSSITSSDNSQMRVFYQFFPRQPIAYSSVALLTTPSCALCDTTANWLTAAGVAFQLNPTNLGASVAATAATEAAQHGYPVLVRLGSDIVVHGGADPVAAARLLAISYPTLIETHVPTVSNVAPASGPYGITIEAQWLQMIVENDKPHIILERRDGVGDLSPTDAGDWEFTQLMPSPPHIQDSLSLQFSKRYPALPGGGIGLGRMVTRQAPYNDTATVDDFVMLYNSEAFQNGGRTQRGYTLWHFDGGGATDSAYHQIQTVSQLIPAATFYVALGAHGTPGALTGELANYVTSQALVTDGTDRFYKVVVDLRQVDEKATNGNIADRGVGGSVHVDTQTDSGAPDARDISLALLVENTRLRTFDPTTRVASRDITMEAVHFTGADDHWVVSNNTGLPSEIPCGSNVLNVDPFSAATFTAAQVAGTATGSCLDGLQVQPTVIADCHTWDDVKLVLAGDTIAALNGSLPLSRSEGVNNWELSYDSRSVYITRLVSFDRPIDELAPTGSCPASAGEIEGAAAAVVRISGEFIGSGEFQPSVTIVDRGNAAILTTPKAQPGSLAWEREWLVFESSMLEANLSFSILNEAASSVLWLGRLNKRAAYQRQLVATRALLHCNYLGVGFDDVRQVISRSAEIPQALLQARVCLADFLRHPDAYWPSYSPAYWGQASIVTDFVGSVIAGSLTANPTLAYLAASSDGTVLDYGEFLIPRAHDLASHGNDVATDFELDIYARMATAASRELVGFDGKLLRVALLSGQLERSAMHLLKDCAQQPGAPTLARMLELTNQKAYQPGIPCVDARVSASRDQWFQLIGIALRSGTWGAVMDAAGRDLDLAYKLLDKLDVAYTAAATLESRYPEGTTDAQWKADLPAADRLMIAIRQSRVTQAARGHQITIAELPQVLAGMTECGAGFVKGLWPDGILMMGLGAAALAGGPLTAAIGGVIFLGFGTYVTGLGAIDLAQAWDSLDLTAKTAGICGTAIGVILTAASIVPTVSAARSLTLADLKYRPRVKIEPTSVPPTGRSTGLTLEEQLEALAPHGGDIEQPAPVVLAPIDATIQTAINALPAAEQGAAAHAVRALNVDAMTPVEKTVVTQLLESTSRSNRLDLKLQFLQGLGKRGTPEYVAWEVVGNALVEALAKPLPKSIAAVPVAEVPATATTPAIPAHIAGTDAEIIQALNDAGVPPEGILPNHDPNAVVSRKGQLLAAVADSERMLEALQDPGFQRLFTFKEANALFERGKAAHSPTTSAFFKELAGTSFVTAVKSAVERAQQLAGATGVAITALKSKLLQPGQSKVVVRLTATLSDGRTVDIAVAKGDVTTIEAGRYATLGPEEITQNLLTPLVENVDGTQSLLITEYLPGLEVPPGDAGLIQLVIATQNADYAGAIGALDARIWLRAKDTSGNPFFNTDLHLRNINVFERNGVKTARAVDFDPQYDRAASEAEYWVASLLRRNTSGAFGVLNQDAYLTNVLETFSNEPGSSQAAGLELLRRTRADLDNPAVVGPATDLVGEVTDLLLSDAKRSLDDFLAAHSPQSLIQFPAVASLYELAPAA